MNGAALSSARGSEAECLSGVSAQCRMHRGWTTPAEAAVTEPSAHLEVPGQKRSAAVTRPLRYGCLADSQLAEAAPDARLPNHGCCLRSWPRQVRVRGVHAGWRHVRCCIACLLTW